MKYSIFIAKSLLLFTIGVTALIVSQSVFAAAAGQPAGTTISNSATVNYKVGTIDQTAENSNTAAFVVDRKVDFTVVTDEGAAVSVTPGSSGNVLTFTVDNTGNDTFDFDLAAVALSGTVAKFSGTDNIDASAASVYVESGANIGYQSGEDTTTSINDLAAGSNVKVYIVSSFAVAVINGDIASYYLRATALDSAGAALTDHSGVADTVGTVQNVFATDDGPAPTDGNLDQIDSDYADYSVSGAVLSVAKTSVVIEDPVNGTSNPKAIPGAVVEYTITIDNAAGAATATDITVADSLATEITNGNILFKTDGYTGGGIQVTAPNINSGTAKDLTNGSGDDEGDWNVTTANTVTVTGISLAASQSASVKFRVTVQ